MVTIACLIASAMVAFLAELLLLHLRLDLDSREAQPDVFVKVRPSAFGHIDAENFQDNFQIQYGKVLEISAGDVPVDDFVDTAAQRIVG